MRLLKLEKDGNVSLTDDLIENIPQYAILSHTWGKPAEEVAYKDLLMANVVDSTKKPGYQKIKFCGEQAARDKLDYFWVDTCCIDKSSSAELSEAINCMFRWYRNAARCYVYLSDVQMKKRKSVKESSETTWEPAFRSSRWFTRGWTLQELVAPIGVEFFSSEGERLGDKISLQQTLHEITGIAVTALQGYPLSQFSITERMSWAETRRTTREEDCAYSLLGIFNVQMPLVYGEGRKKALDRLREEIDKALHGKTTTPS